MINSEELAIRLAVAANITPQTEIQLRDASGVSHAKCWLDEIRFSDAS